MASSSRVIPLGGKQRHETSVPNWHRVLLRNGKLRSVRVFCQAVQQAKELRRLADKESIVREAVDRSHRCALRRGRTND